MTNEFITDTAPRPVETAFLGLGRIWRWLVQPRRDEATTRPGRRWMNG